MEKALRELGDIHMTLEQHKKFDEFITGDDMDFYEEYIIYLSRQEQERFFAENPDFLSEFQVSYDNIDLLKDKMYRNILRKVKKYAAEGEN
ncbi:MAG TPA: hypothetical protein DIW07_11415 [Lachnospiraceae bacterium]|uniref:Uncharacterized protein n=2 Tax=Muricomes intestini TaxID=1796634 RepID=A0A4R3KGU7_9FIRM|nr:hypothetical protein EDD59_102115 [Muricomes intestini]HAX53103.1 hypothetical protein [Lachnospiraceae bacterium]HCR83996.1 hypothetical protein [Lachnospiraceae bacterium]